MTTVRVPLRPRDLIAVALVAVCALAASGTHVVRSGDTLGTIAARNGTSVRELVEANGLRDPNVILVGQQLKIPGGRTDTGAPTPATTHTVARGDTLGRIASRYGTTVAAIAVANGIADPNRIRIGQQLTVTGGTGGSDAPSSRAPTPAPTGRQLTGQRHTVQAGETLAGIARRYGISSADLGRWNGIVNGRIYATTRLVLFDPGTLPGTGSIGSATHTVSTGETLSSIATRYGVSPSAIASASTLDDPNRLRVGQQLTVPGASSIVQCPVPGGSFFNDWAFPRSGGRSHAGNDIFAPRGTPIVAPVSGHVDVATGALGGHQFRLTAADGTLWFGSHLDRFGASGPVTAGTVIGYVGDSGNAKGSRPHLHFEIHPSGQAVNPYPLLRTVC